MRNKRIKNPYRAVSQRSDAFIVVMLASSAFMWYPITVAAIAATFVYILAKGEFRIIASLRGAKTLFCFCALGIAVPLCAGNYVGAGIGVCVLLMASVALYLRCKMTVPLLEYTLFTACVMSLFSFVVALIGFAFSGFSSEYRASATFYNPNYYATMAVFVIIICVCRLLSSATPKKRFYIAVLIVNAAALYLCNCRTAYPVAFAAAFVVAFCSGRKRLALGISCAGAAFAFLLLLFPELLPRLDLLSQSFSVRKSIWSASADAISDNLLFGLGARSYSFISAAYDGFPAEHTHCLYLDVMLNYGITGVTLLLAYFVCNLSALRRRLKLDRSFFALSAGLLCALLLHGVFDITAFWFQTGLLLCIILGCTGELLPNTVYSGKAIAAYTVTCNTRHTNDDHRKE